MEGCDSPDKEAKKLLNQRCYNDSKEGLEIIGGVEQSGFASLANQTGAFMSVFTRAGLNTNWKVWGRIRFGINVLAFGAQERTSFLRKYAFGICTIDRFMDPSDSTCCERGLVDFTLGQESPLPAARFTDGCFASREPTPCRSAR